MDREENPLFFLYLIYIQNGMKDMIRITKQERDALEKVGLIRFRKQYGNKIVQDSNLVITNKDHVGKNSKTYYIVEEPTLMKFLGYYDGLNLQRINDSQFELLVEKGLLTEDKIQHWGEYKSNAVCYENQFGERRIVKVTQLMLALGLWKTNKGKRIAKTENSVMDDLLSNADNINNVNDTGNVPDAGYLVEPEKEQNDFTDMFNIK